MTEISFADVRVVPACIDRWQRIAPNCIALHDDGRIWMKRGSGMAVVCTDGRLRVACPVSPQLTLFLTACAGEWGRLFEFLPGDLRQAAHYSPAANGIPLSNGHPTTNADGPLFRDAD